MIKFFKCSLLTTFLIISTLSFAQKNQFFYHYIDKLGLEYVKPANFFESDSVDSFSPSNKIFLSWTNYRLISRDNDLVIYTIMMAYDSIQVKRIKNMSPNYSWDQNYLAWINSKADTINSKVVFFKGKQLAEYNADRAGTYTMIMKRPYKGIYTRATVLFMSKREVGDIEFVYFYTKDTPLQKYLEQTQHMVKFKRY